MDSSIQSEMATMAFCTAIGRALVDRGVVDRQDIIKYLKDFKKDLEPLPIAADNVQIMIQAVESW